MGLIRKPVGDAPTTSTRPPAEPDVAVDRLRVLETAVHHAHDMIVVTDRNARIEYCNASFTRITGYTAEEVCGRQTSVLKSGHHAPSFYAELWNTILSGQVWHGEMVNRRKDGRVYPEEMTITPIADERGMISRFVAIKRDLSVRRQAEAREKETRQFLEKLIDVIPLPVFAQDASGACFLFNAEFERFTGLQRRDISGRQIQEMIGAENAELCRDTDALAVQTRRSQVCEARLQPALGEPGYYRIHKAVVADAPALSPAILGVLVDLSAIRRLHDLEAESSATRRAIKSMQRIIGVIGHELRSPLCSIRAAAEVQGHDGMSREHRARLTDIILGESRRAGEVVDTIVTLTEMVSGSTAWTWERFDLVELLAGVCRAHSAKLDGQRVSLDFLAQSLRVPINGDRKTIERLFSSLVLNAVQYTHDGTIEVRIREGQGPAGRQAEVSIADSGPGLKPGIVERLELPFSLSSGLIGREQANGTGLGLAISKVILDAHGGGWTIRSEPGRGTRFDVVIPAEAAGPSERK